MCGPCTAICGIHESRKLKQARPRTVSMLTCCVGKTLATPSNIAVIISLRDLFVKRQMFSPCRSIFCTAYNRARRRHQEWSFAQSCRHMMRLRGTFSHSASRRRSLRNFLATIATRCRYRLRQVEKLLLSRRSHRETSVSARYNHI